MKRLRDLARAAGDAALQLTLPLFDQIAPAPVRAPASRPVPPSTTEGGTPAAHSPGISRRLTRLGGHPVEYELRRSRRRTIGFCIDDSGLRVTAPRWVGIAEIDSALSAKEAWILRKLVEWREHAGRRERLAVRWEDGGTVAFLGRTLTMHIDAGARGVTIDNDTLRIGLPAQADAGQLKNAVQAWMQTQARAVFRERLPIYSERLGAAPTQLRLSSARTRWGSCAPDGSIRLNWRLVHFPIEIIDYVVVHELAHLKEMNHGPDFWATVESLLPEFDTARQQLKQFPDDLTLS